MSNTRNPAGVGVSLNESPPTPDAASLSGNAGAGLLAGRREIPAKEDRFTRGGRAGDGGCSGCCGGCRGGRGGCCVECRRLPEFGVTGARGGGSGVGNARCAGRGLLCEGVATGEWRSVVSRWGDGVEGVWLLKVRAPVLGVVVALVVAVVVAVVVVVNTLLDN